jgi:hypothetical protein
MNQTFVGEFNPQGSQPILKGSQILMGIYPLISIEKEKGKCFTRKTIGLRNIASMSTTKISRYSVEEPDGD